MTQIICDRCNRPMLHLSNKTDNIIVTLCSGCAEKESLRDSSLLEPSWEKFKVGTFGDISREGKAFTCEVMKASHNYVNIKVTENHEPYATDYFVLIRNYDNSRIDFFRKRSRYALGFAARDFLIDLLNQQKGSLAQMGSSPFIEALEVVGGIAQ